MLLMALPNQGEGAGVVLQNNDGTVVSLSFKLDFPCSNIAEYEALVIGLVSVCKWEFGGFE